MPRKKNTGKRRSRGEGAVFYREDLHSWVAQPDLGRDPVTGKRLRPLIKGATSEEVTLKLAELRVDRSRGVAVDPSKEILRDYLWRWFRVYKQPFVKANTAEKIKGNIHRIEASPFADLPACKIPHETLQVWINTAAVVYSEATLRTTVSTLSMAYDKLVEQKRIYVNPAAGILVPSQARKAEEAKAMDDETRMKFLAAAKPTPHYVPLLFMLSTGLRSGELCALDIQDYKDHIGISKTWSSAANAVQSETKTASSNRTIPKPVAMDALMTTYMFKLHHKEATAPLFQTVKSPYGRLKPTHLDDIVGRIADAIGEPWITPHTLRHSFASTLFRQGIKINVVSKLLGHKDVSTTYNIYIHMIPQELDEAAEAVGRVMMDQDTAL
jgi:integrase